MNVTVFPMFCNGPLVTVYYILREQNANVYFTRLQYMWNLTDESANFMLAYETNLY